MASEGQRNFSLLSGDGFLESAELGFFFFCVHLYSVTSSSRHVEKRWQIHCAEMTACNTDTGRLSSQISCECRLLSCESVNILLLFT